jgi:hypothetical protein
VSCQGAPGREHRDTRKDGVWTRIDSRAPRQRDAKGQVPIGVRLHGYVNSGAQRPHGSHKSVALVDELHLYGVQVGLCN